MIYWLLALFLLIIIIVASNYFKKQSLTKKRIAEIKEQWAKRKDEHLDFNLIASYLTATGGKFAASAADLDLDYVFSYLDRTSSKPGQQCLFKQLHSPEISDSYFTSLEKRIKDINTDKQQRELVQLKLSELNDSDAYSLPRLFMQNHQSLFAPLVKFYINIAAPVIIGLIVGLFIAPNAGYLMLLFIMVIINLGVHYSNKSKMVSYTRSLPQLLLLIKTSKWLFDKGMLNDSEQMKQSLL